MSALSSSASSASTSWSFPGDLSFVGNIININIAGIAFKSSSYKPDVVRGCHVWSAAGYLK
jgi:hypothetical protein